MLESQFTANVKRKLIEKGFFYKKLRDTSTQGIPDTFIAKKFGIKRKGLFLEIKFAKRENVPFVWREKSIFLPGGGKKVQLMTMIELQENFNAQYLMGIQTRNTLNIYLINPLQVFALIEKNTYIPLHYPNSLSTISTRLEEFLKNYC